MINSFSMADIEKMLVDLESYSQLKGETLNSLILSSISTTYDKFICTLYQYIEKAILRLEQNKKIRINDEEDRITEEIITYLCGCGYAVSHDTTHGGGHCDIVVKLNNYIWLGEAKIHNSYEYLMKGFKQLTSRYATGTDFCCQGSLFIYCFNKDAVSVVKEWKDKLKSSYGDNCISKEQCKDRPSFSFYSIHKHESSGIDYKVKHIFAVLHYDPKDVKH